MTTIVLAVNFTFFAILIGAAIQAGDRIQVKLFALAFALANLIALVSQ